MKFLFVHQNFPAQFLHIVRYLARTGQHEIVFLTEPNDNLMAGVRKVPYNPISATSAEVHWTIRELDQAVRRAERVGTTARNLRQLGFNPDIIIGHHGWGELLALQDVWPSTPILGYYEFFYHTENSDVGFDAEFPTGVEDFPRIRAKNAVNLLALAGPSRGQTPTKWQLSTYPDWAQEKIALLPEGVELDTCRPDPAVRRAPFKIGGWDIAPDERLITYVARDLEPYRGFHILLRALPRILRERRDVRVIMVGGNGVSYGSPPPEGNWRDRIVSELGEQLDLSRVLFPGRIPYATYVRMLQRSDAHVYLTYPFVASWSLREALASGCVVIGSDTPPVIEFIKHEHTGIVTPFFDVDRLGDTILTVLDDHLLSTRLRAQAREWAEANLAMPDYLAAYLDLIAGLVGDRAEGLVLPKKTGLPFHDPRQSLKSKEARVRLAAASNDISFSQSQLRSARRR